MNELKMSDEKIVIDVEKLFPEAARRVEILNDLKKSWKNIVGHLAMFSCPYNLGVDEISIYAKNKNARNILFNMRGNITKILQSRYNYKINENFKVNIFEGRKN